MSPRLTPQSDDRTDLTVRRCLVSGKLLPKSAMIRFAIDPEGRVIPDIREKLPGRGLWLSADRTVLLAACRRNAFARAMRGATTVPLDLVERTEQLLVARCLDLLGLARRANQATFGLERTRLWLCSGKAGVLIAARGGRQADQSTLRALALELAVIQCLDPTELGAAFGRTTVVHAALSPGRLAGELNEAANRLAGMRIDHLADGSASCETSHRIVDLSTAHP